MPLGHGELQQTICNSYLDAISRLKMMRDMVPNFNVSTKARTLSHVMSQYISSKNLQIELKNGNSKKRAYHEISKEEEGQDKLK